MKIIASLLLSTALFSVLPINATGNSKQRLFETKKTDTIPYRIPAIATCSNGDLIAVSDYRYCKADIGFGPVDLHYRISRDNGRTWGPEALLADGNGIEKGNVWDYAFGDCAIVADRNGSEVLVLCVAGKMPYSRSMRANPTRIVSEVTTTVKRGTKGRKLLSKFTAFSTTAKPVLSAVYLLVRVKFIKVATSKRVNFIAFMLLSAHIPAIL